jgi:hypothetical protein
VDVDQVSLVEGGDVDLEDGDGAVAGEVDALEVEVGGGGMVGWLLRMSTRADMAAGVSIRPVEPRVGVSVVEDETDMPVSLGWLAGDKLVPTTIRGRVAYLGNILGGWSGGTNPRGINMEKGSLGRCSKEGHFSS